ncbi:Hypothetical protein HEAR3036 [Herminiimonas arsenicoxydans]|uniref:Uncharacterized protein n=1 Tax=Herminiimonas arsenicoxydans TaxID=204773 RepID=A4G9F8_HERAR|nr:Hypothetical protein HEAR3036 [Herminiimonas arsenicoxydans]
MNIVFFGTELSDKYPEVMGSFLLESEQEHWLTLQDVLSALFQGDNIAIRQATQDEMERAETYGALYDIGKQLGVSYGRLLDYKGEDHAKEFMAYVMGVIDAAKASVEVG